MLTSFQVQESFLLHSIDILYVLGTHCQIISNLNTNYYVSSSTRANVYIILKMFPQSTKGFKIALNLFSQAKSSLVHPSKDRGKACFRLWARCQASKIVKAESLRSVKEGLPLYTCMTTHIQQNYCRLSQRFGQMSSQCLPNCCEPIYSD